MGVMVSSSCCFCCYILFRDVIPLLQRGDPPMGDNPLKTLQCESFTWATILHKLLQQWFSHGYNPSGTVCSNVGSPRGQKSCQQICSCFGFSIHGDGACQEVALVWASHGVTVATGLFWRWQALLQHGRWMLWYCLTLFNFLTKQAKMVNSAPHEAQKSFRNLMKAMLKVLSASQVQVDWQ